jgi:hypothetical protein
MPFFLHSMYHFRSCVPHTVCLTDILDPSPPPRFKTFQIFPTYFLCVQVSTPYKAMLQMYWSYFLCSYLPPTWPSSRVHKTVTTASGTGLSLASLATLEGGSCTVPEVVVTVVCTPDDGCDWHPKHVEWTCRIINRLLCFASRWTVITIDCD